MISFFIDGEPVAKQSFRMGKNGGYTSASVKAWQEVVSLYARQNCDKPIGGKVCLKLNFYLSNHRRVDCDNLSKAVMDGLKGIAFGDDSEVARLVITKDVNPDRPGVQVFCYDTESVRQELDVIDMEAK